MYKKNNFLIIILFGIFALALFLRFFRLSDFPVGFHQDEASLGYNGYSLLQTGKDENNHPYPLYIDMFGDNRPSGYHYLTILPIKFFGLSEFSTRFPGALFGSLSIFAIYFLSLYIFQNKKFGLLAAFLFAVSPWHIVLSRASAEAIVALFFIMLGFAFIIRSVSFYKRLDLFWGSLCLIISFFFYHTPRVFVPGLFAVFILMFLPIIKKSAEKYRVAVFFTFILVSAISLFLVFGIKGGTERYSQVNIFSSFETDFFQKQQIQEDAIAGSNHIISRIFHNKITNVSLIFINNYFDYFGFNFLFTKGGLPIWYSIPRVGLLYLLELPLILLGIYYLISNKNIYYKIPLVWLLIAPIVPAITMDDVPNINRAIVMFPMLEIIAGFGFLSFIKSIKYKNRATILITLLLLFNSLYFFQQYFYNAKTHKPWYRNNGFSKMMQIVNGNLNSYDAVVMSKFQGGIYPLVLFYAKYDPKTYQREGSPKNIDYGGFGKFFFVPQDCPSMQRNDKTPKGHALYIDKGDCPWDKSLAVRKYSYIYREDGTKAFRIVYD